MDAFLDKWYIFKSRKFWAFIGGVLSLYLATAQMHPFPIDTFVQGLVALVLGYITTVAWEDSAAKKADATVEAANVTAAATQATTTVSTPGTSDVQVQAAPDATPATIVVPGASTGLPVSQLETTTIGGL